MISKWKVAAIIVTTVAKMAFVSPAFAQSFDPEIGTGNVLMLNNQASVPHPASGCSPEPHRCPRDGAARAGRSCFGRPGEYRWRKYWI